MTIRSINTSGLPQGVLDTVNQLLFDSGQVGGNLPFTDFSKIWQDSAGTTPYTAVEQYAGLLLNKAVPQVSNGTARVNIIADSTNFASTSTCVITNNKFVATAASGYHSYTTSALAPGAVYKVKLKVKAAEYTKLYIADASHGNFAVAVDLVALTYSGAQGTATSISVTSLGSGIVEVQLTATDYGDGASVVGVVGYPSTGATLNFWGAQYTGDGVSGLYVYAVDVRLLSDEAVLPAYQRIDNNVWVPYSSGCFYQATSAARPVVSARVNGFTATEDISQAAWLKRQVTVSGVDKIQEDSSTNLHYLRQDVPVFAGVYTLSFEAKQSERTIAWASLDGSSNTLWFDLANGVSGGIGAGSSKITSIGDGWYKCEYIVTKTAGTAACFVGCSNSTTITNYPGVTGNGIFLRKLAIAKQGAAYQRVNTPTDYDTAGFPNYAKVDGIDDNWVSAAGGGGTAGIYYCGAVRFNKVGAVQTIFSDAGTNSGYKLQLTAANQLQISAGNGTAFTAINTTDVFALGDVSLCEIWDDGTNLGVRLGEGTPVTVARPAVTAGTAQITIGKDNNAASSYAGINMFEPVWRYGAMPNQTQREAIRAICRAKARLQ